MFDFPREYPLVGSGVCRLSIPRVDRGVHYTMWKNAT
jgi:hypothetical protein